MTKQLTKLFGRFEALAAAKNAEIAAVKAEIQTVLNKQYKAWKPLKKATADLEAYEKVEYCTNEYGDAIAWIRFYDLEDVPEAELEYLENYLSDFGIIVDWENQTLSQCMGPDEIYINDYGRNHDRGVYQCCSKIIDESEYTDEDGEVNEVKRNALIEVHMEKTGYYPGVFRISQHDNCLYPVNTQWRCSVKA